MMEQLQLATEEWSFLKKLGFRFFFSLFVLFVLFYPNGFFPYFDYLFEIYIQPFRSLIPWIGTHILHTTNEPTAHPTGSGDTLYDWVTLFFISTLSVLVTIVWSIIPTSRKNYNVLYYWLTVLVRYYLAFTMLSYGFYKVFKLQFPFPSTGTLMEPYGNSSPMRLAWTFMGFSKGYNYFTGFGEVFSGVFLLFRRTKTMGALLTLVVAANVMAINYCFDVPVKLLSTTLVVMSLFLLAKDLQRLLQFLVLNTATAPADIATPTFKKPWINKALVIVKYGTILFIFVTYIYQGSEALSQYGDDAPKPALYGIYTTEQFVKNKDTLTPLATDSLYWHKLIVGSYGYATVMAMNDSLHAYVFETDTAAKKITMYTDADTTNKSILQYSQVNNTLQLNGIWQHDTVSIKMQQFPLQNFRLINRGFHWVSEYPFNK